VLSPSSLAIGLLENAPPLLLELVVTCPGCCSQLQLSGWLNSSLPAPARLCAEDANAHFAAQAVGPEGQLQGSQASSYSLSVLSQQAVRPDSLSCRVLPLPATYSCGASFLGATACMRQLYVLDLSLDSCTEPVP
jgi:hypothetical protein